MVYVRRTGPGPALQIIPLVQVEAVGHAHRHEAIAGGVEETARYRPRVGHRRHRLRFLAPAHLTNVPQATLLVQRRRHHVVRVARVDVHRLDLLGMRFEGPHLRAALGAPLARVDRGEFSVGVTEVPHVGAGGGVAPVLQGSRSNEVTV